MAKAAEGTLFIDEVGDMPLEAQAKLLRAIEAREIERVGGAKPIRIDVRVVSATNKDLARCVSDGTFREDLFFRLNVIPIELPPLRDRLEDLGALVAHFSALYRARSGRPAPVWSEGAMRTLARYRWPGNVRELANIVERLAILHGGETVQEAHVRAVLPVDGYVEASPADAAITAPLLPLADALDAYERALIMRALAAASSNVAEAARRLQTDRPSLYRRMKRLGIGGS
jgi:transcriptional regulator with GAF, ATPase, and Fis domain